MTWKQKLLDTFIADLGHSVWAVSDPDNIVRNEEILASLQDKGFDIMFFEDPIAFRFEYETRIRPQWEGGAHKPVIVLFDDRINGFDDLPSDLLTNARRYTFGLDELFPRFDSGVLRELPPAKWTVLDAYAATDGSRHFRPGETEEIVLRHCFALVPEVIDSGPELIRRLVDMHRRDLQLPPRLATRLESELKNNPALCDWPVAQLASNAENLWRFLQERLERHVAGNEREHPSSPDMKFPVPESLDFNDPLLKGYVENLIEDGILKIEMAGGQPPGEGSKRMIPGITDKWCPAKVSAQMLDRLLERLPEAEAVNRDWVLFGQKYAHAVSRLFLQEDSGLQVPFWKNPWPAIDERFSAWLDHAYRSLHNLPSSPPVMVHHIPKQMNRWRKQGRKVALVVLDGLSCAGWHTIRDLLRGELPQEVQMTESAVFTWVPTMTPVCRQSLYSGIIPRLLGDSIGRTDRDSRRWQDFWEANGGLLPSQIRHALMAGNPQELDELFEGWSSRIEVAGFTVSKPDEIMHGMTLGWRGWHQQLQLWMQSGFLNRLVNHLLAHGFTIGITADHGNLEASGCGKINEGVMADNRGQRVRIYADQDLRDSAAEKHPSNTRRFDDAMLPDGIHPLFASGRGAFVSEGDSIVTHGGLSLDELLVPWVVMERGPS